MLILFQSFFLFFVLASLWIVFEKRKRGQLSNIAAAFWSLLWATAAAVVFWPNGATIAANWLGIGRGADLVLYLSLAIVFFLLLRLHIKIEAISRDVTKVVRKNALDEK